jgi:hypothetical protein
MIKGGRIFGGLSGSVQVMGGAIQAHGAGAVAASGGFGGPLDGRLLGLAPGQDHEQHHGLTQP